MTLHGDPCVILVDDRLFNLARASLPDWVRLLVVEDSGCIRAAEETVPPAGTVPLRGIPAGLQAMAVSKALTWTVEAIAALALRTGTQTPFDMLVVEPGKAAGMDGAVSRFFTGTMARIAGEQQARLTQVEVEATHLRQEVERLLLLQERGRALVEAVGLETDVVVSEQPLGRQTVGPGGDIDTRTVRQRLSVDSAALAAFAFYVDESSLPDAETGQGKPVLTMRLVRPGDGVLLHQVSFAAADLAPGWNRVHLSRVEPSTFGDGVLEILWPGVDEGPRLRLAGGMASRIEIDGDRERRTLAMKLFKGIGGMVRLPSRTDLMPAEPLVREQRPFADVWPDLCFLDDGEEAVDLPTRAGFNPYSRNPDAGWIQTHPVQGTVIGVAAAGYLPAMCRQVQVSVSLDHAEAAPCAVAIYASPSVAGESRPRTFQHASGILKQFARSGDADDLVAGGALGPACVLKKLAANTRAVLALDFDDLLDGPHDLVLAVVPLLPETQYGWLRWHDIRFGYDPDPQCADMAPLVVADTADISGRAGVARKMMRIVRFPELAREIAFLGGEKRLDTLTETVGFRPLLISEDVGYLQTHPLDSEPSGALVPHVITAGAEAVSLHFHTAHEAAPHFLYIAVFVRDDIADPIACARSLYQTLDPSGSRDRSGDLENGAVVWQAVRTAGATPRVMHQTFDPGSDATWSLVLMVKPVENGNTRYGWCRWTTLSVRQRAIAAADADG
ncbi:DUF6212 domain-containing protein [Eilatimonas milleporae]|uniref:DUF6212 domain-containing protein n=1 Tax=Eilatimonas milleporae TaxID=911205 RepID=UPI0011C4036E|nr:DUF6212 domain-containing protein [Eilatimonas milleporae]